MQLRETELGTEKLCPRCKEWWPHDNEFFPTHNGKKHGLSSWCKACWAEYKREQRKLEAVTA